MELTTKAIGSTRPVKVQRISPYMNRRSLKIDEVGKDEALSSFETNGTVLSVLNPNLVVDKVLNNEFCVVDSYVQSKTFMDNSLTRRVRDVNSMDRFY